MVMPGGSLRWRVPPPLELILVDASVDGPRLPSALLSERKTDGSVPNTHVVANCEIVKPRVAAAEHISQFNEEARSPSVKMSKTIIHPGEVNRIRELPQNSKIVATHTHSPDVLTWDVDSQPNRHAVLGAAESRPDLILTGHKENAEFALGMCPAEPFVLSGGKDKLVVLWSIHDHISALGEASKSPAASPGGSGGKQAKAGSDKSSEGTKVAARGVFQGHSDTVEDVQFAPSSSQEFCSVGDEACIILWDARDGSSPVVKRLFQRAFGTCISGRVVLCSFLAEFSAKEHSAGSIFYLTMFLGAHPVLSLVNFGGFLSFLLKISSEPCKVCQGTFPYLGAYPVKKFHLLM